ncbi:hypothetical protein [Mesoflavibacter profundi]|uniref:hypothetical protein n=1 Tax=Mesoflavibacter profundi TaxID=2708110 RepID=UPI003511CF45
MYLYKNDTIIPVKVLECLKTGDVVDDRVIAIETIVAKMYNTTVHELDVYYKDSPAKLMTCFLIFDLLHYSIPSIAVKYKINSHFLKNKIRDTYKKCLQDHSFLEYVDGLRTALKQKNEVCNV